MNQTNLKAVDWSTLPAPADDGAARHLEGARLPNIALAATSGEVVNLGALSGWSVLYLYPMTGQPGQGLPVGWDAIPGARGCTPQSCAFRDHAAALAEAGLRTICGISSQSTAEQTEAAARLHLPCPLLSDAGFALAEALRIPTFVVDGRSLLRRLTLIADGSDIQKVFYPVFPPERNAAEVLDWIRSRQRGDQPNDDRVEAPGPRGS